MPMRPWGPGAEPWVTEHSQLPILGVALAPNQSEDGAMWEMVFGKIFFGGKVNLSQPRKIETCNMFKNHLGLNIEIIGNVSVSICFNLCRTAASCDLEEKLTLCAAGEDGRALPKNSE